MTLPLPDSTGDQAFHFEVACVVDRPLLRMLRRFVTSVAEEMGFGEDDAAMIEIAVDEACSNIARHAYHPEDHRRHEIKLQLRIEPDALLIRVRDYGDGGLAGPLQGAIDFDDYLRPDRERYDGLGLLIIHKFMDEARIDASPGQGTTVTMRKYLRAPDARTSAPHRREGSGECFNPAP